MSLVRLIAVEPCNGHNPGEDFYATEREAKQLLQRRLVRMAVGSSNKMLPPPANKANPSPAAGEAPPSSASPAAPASVQTTAQLFGTGAPVARKTAARKTSAASSSSTTAT